METPKKILIIEDEESSRRILADFLRDEKEFQIFEAANGEEALEIIRKERPELALSDIAMPVMNGAEFARILSKEFPDGPTRIIFLTNSSELSTISDVSTPLVAGYFVKANIDLRELLQKIKDYFAGGKA